jgi:hypothetical protein
MCDVTVCRCEDIVEGEPAELLVLSQDDTFFNFKVRRQQQPRSSASWLLPMCCLMSLLFSHRQQHDGRLA